MEAKKNKNTVSAPTEEACLICYTRCSVLRTSYGLKKRVWQTGRMPVAAGPQCWLAPSGGPWASTGIPVISFSVFLSLQASPSPSPVGYSPMTPGAPSPGGYNPHTPGSGIEQSSSDWVTTDIQVKVRDTYLDSQVVGQTGVIRSVTVRE